VNQPLPPADPGDILVVGWLRERFSYPQFVERQVMSTNATERLRGRLIRRAWIAPEAYGSPRYAEFEAYLVACVRRFGGEILPIREYEGRLLADEQDRLSAEALERIAEAAKPAADALSQLGEVVGGIAEQLAVLASRSS
jgi:hypothetical protein